MMVESVLTSHYKILRWTVDMHDWERVLKVEAAPDLSPLEVEQILGQFGYQCSELDH